MPFTVRRHINRGSASLCCISRHLFGLANLRTFARLTLIVSFLLGGFAMAQTPEKKTIGVRFISSQCSGKSDFAGTSISIDGIKVEMKQGSQTYIQLAPGTHVISDLSEQDYPNAKIARVRVGFAGRSSGDYLPISGSVTVTLEERLFSIPSQIAGIDIFTENDCGDEKTGQEEESQEEDKTVWLIPTSYDCDKESYEGYSINIDGHPIKLDSNHVAVPLRKGKHRISISVQGYPEAKIKMANILRPNREKYFGTREADNLGEIDLEMDQDLWDGATATHLPAVFLYTTGDCPPSYEPPLQRLDGPPRVKVVSVEGKVTISNDKSDNESQATIGSMVEDQQIIYTRPGASVQLVASDKRLFLLPGSTVVKFSISKNSTGTWEINCEQRSGAIGVRHVGYDRNAPKGYEWKILTPTAAITEKGTVYTVTYDEKSNVTTVGVEQGQVEITPTNTSLNAFTLDDHKMLDIFEGRVSTITPYFTAADPKGLNFGTANGGSLLDNKLLIVGIAGGGLLGFLIFVVVIYLIYRLLKRTPARSAFQPAGFNPQATPSGPTPKRDAAASSRRCPNPNCGNMVRAGKKFCTACGTSVLK
jgi:hypothetical protein